MPNQTLYPFIAIAVLIVSVACAGATASPGPSGGVNVPKEDREPSNCSGAETIREIRSEYAANKFRARETYVDLRLCVRGTITAILTPLEAGVSAESLVVNVSVNGADARFRLILPREEPPDFHDSIPPGLTVEQEVNIGATRTREWEEKQQRRVDEWREWVISKSVGDIVEADCTFKGITPLSRKDQAAPGKVVLRDCELVEG